MKSDEVESAAKPVGATSGSPPSAPLGVQFNPNKAGIDVTNLERIQKIVQDAARGGRFFQEQQRKEAILVAQVEELREKAASAPAVSLAADAVVSRVEGERGSGNRVFVCVDFDAFFSSVAALDDPSLVGKPHAVGGGRNGVLSTSSYEARKYGVRSAMPTFVARKLCPELILVPANYARYQELSNLTAEKVFSKYGPFEMRSLDECILDITEYCEAKAPENSVQEVVDGLRREVTEVTGGLTCSAGCASTSTLAKICADMNKPNGSFFLPSDRDSIVTFCRGLKLRAVPFLGKVTERLLQDTFGISQVGEILDHRAALHHCLSSRTYEFLIRAVLGVEGASIDGPGVRKSVSRERTFMPLKDQSKQREIVKNLCEMVCEDIRGLEGLDGGRCVTLKVKTSDFRVRSRSKTVRTVLGRDSASLTSVVLPLLEAEFPCESRLLGVRLSDLVGPRVDAAIAERMKMQDPNQSRIDKYFRGGQEYDAFAENSDNACVSKTSPTLKFKDKDAREHTESISEVRTNWEVGAGVGIADNDADDGSFEFEIPSCPASQLQPVEENLEVAGEGSKDSEALLVCPVCKGSSYKDLGSLNRHVDLCLNAEAGLVPPNAAASPGHRKAKRRKKQTAMDFFIQRKL